MIAINIENKKVMKTESLVSLIVPVYNAEKYLHQCIDSLLEQTYPHLEIILVDDGSYDSSGKICDEYALMDGRVKVIHQSNGGVSSARQTGVETALGEYTIHVDPDDWVDSTMIERLVGKIQEDDADMVICDFWTEDSTGSHYCSQNPGDDVSSESILKKILYQQLHGSCWNKLLKRTSYNGIGFFPRHICIIEDELFNLRVLARNVKVSYLPEAFYHYRTTNNASLCHSISDKSFQSKIDVITALEKELNVNPNDFYAIKKNVLFDAMRTKRYSLLKTLYPEIHAIIINDGIPYHWYMPQTCCLAIALKGFPRLAYHVYNLNMRAVTFGQKLKNKCY